MTDPAQSVRGFFITGTDTGVGKTVVGSNLIRHWRQSGQRVGAYKPVASGRVHDSRGADCWEDIEAYFDVLGGEYPRERICPQCFAAPLAPPVAARVEGREVDEDLLVSGVNWWRTQVDAIIVEGAGGLLSPLSSQQSNADLAARLGMPLLIVARLGLGTINHTLLTVAVAQQRGLAIRGIILNSPTSATDDTSIKTNPEELARRCPVPILGVLPFSPDGDLLQHPSFLRMLEMFGTKVVEGEI